MRKTKGEARCLPRGVKLLSIAAALVLTCVLAVSLIGTSFAAGDEKYITPDNEQSIKVDGFDLTLSRPTGDGYPTYNGMMLEEGGYFYEQWKSYTDTAGKNCVDGTVDCYGNDASANVGLLRIGNKSGQMVVLSFSYEVETVAIRGGAGLKVGNDTINAKSGTYTATLSAEDGFVDIQLSVPDVGVTGSDEWPRATLSITDISVKAVAGKSLELLAPAAGGSYTAVNGNTTKTVTATNESIGFDPQKGETVTLEAAAKSGYVFYLWEDKDGTPLSTSKTLTVDGAKVSTDSVRPVFVAENTAAVYKIPTGDLGGSYYYWDDAMRAALRSSDKNVVLVKTDFALDKAGSHSRQATGTYVNGGTFTVPAGVSLVVPYSDAYSTSTADHVNTGSGNAAVGTAFTTLTVPSGVTLNVNGTLNVNAKQGASNSSSYQSHVIGDYGKMIVGGTVNVNAGGTLYARGYVVDENHTAAQHTGKINVNAGGTLVQMMQITDWRGGTCTSEVYQKVMPINTYYLQNNMVPTDYVFGAAMRAQVSVAYWDTESELVNVPVISNNTGIETGDRSIFVMKGAGARISTDYNYANDKLSVAVESGTVTMNYLQLNVGSLSVDTSGNVLAVSDNLKVTVRQNAELTINYGLKFLPGAELIVEEGGTLAVGKNARLFFYSKDAYDPHWAWGAMESDALYRTRMTAEGLVQKSGQSVSVTEDAKLSVAGKLLVDGRIFQSKQADTIATLVPSSENAVIEINTQPTNYQTLYECYGRGRNTVGAGYENVEAVKTGPGSREYYYILNRNWQSPVGNMAALENQITNEPFGKGTYRAAMVGEDLCWYQYQVTCQYIDKNSRPITNVTQYTPWNYDEITAPIVDGQKYVVTHIVFDDKNPNAKAVTVQSINGTAALEEGWQKARLINLSGDGTITLTVRPYDYVVTWQEYYNGNAEPDNIVKAYVTSGSAATYTAADGVTITGAMTVDSGVQDKVTFDANTVTAKDITSDMTVNVQSTATAKTVTWEVTDETGAPIDVTGCVTVSEDGTATYTVKQDESNGWLVAADEAAVTTNSNAVKIANDHESITVSNISGPVTVKVQLTRYDRRISYGVTYDRGTKENAVEQTNGVLYTNDTTWSYIPESPKSLLLKASKVSGGELVGYDLQGYTDESAKLYEVSGTVVATELERDVEIHLEMTRYYSRFTWVFTADDDPDYRETYREYYCSNPAGWGYSGHYDTYIQENGSVRKTKIYGEQVQFATDAWPRGEEYIPPFADNYSTLATVDEDSQAGCKNLTIGYDYTKKNLQASAYLNFGGNVEKLGNYTMNVKLTHGEYVVSFVDSKDHTRILETKRFAVDKTGVPFDPMTKEAGSPTAQGSYQNGWPVTAGDTYGDRLLITGFTTDGCEVNGKANAAMATTKATALTITAATEKNATVYVDWERRSTVKQGYSVNELFYWSYYSDEQGAWSSIVNYYLLKEDGTTPQNIVLSGDEKTGELVRCIDNATMDDVYTYTTPPAGRYIKELDNCDTAKVASDRLSAVDEGKSAGKYARLVLAAYDKSLACTVDGETQYVYINTQNAEDSWTAGGTYSTTEGTWSYTVSDGRVIDTDSVTVSAGNRVAFSNGNRTITVYGLSENSTVTMRTFGVNTDGYYMGDMSFEYVESAAAFTWDGTESSAKTWTPMNQKVWRHTAGSKTYNTEDGGTLTVANGSILFVNGGTEAKTYTIKLENSSGIHTNVRLVCEGDPSYVTTVGDVTTVTIPAGSRIMVVCSLNGAPDAGLSGDVELGQITVTASAQTGN